jgi:hypothetical protein
MVRVMLSSSASVMLGSYRFPSLATVRDGTLGVVWEGLLPATLSLRRGLYEADVRNESGVVSHDLPVRPPACLDARHVGLPLSTIVPVAAQQGRRQREAEMVSGLSAQLRDSGANGGIAVVIVGGRGGAASTQCEVRHGAKTLFRVTEAPSSEGSVLPGTARAMEPGGYALRIGGAGKTGDESQDLYTPLWISAGYQTLVFVPGGGTRLDRMSVHMLPIRHTWTGFEVGSLLLEGLAAARRHGATALTFHRDLDIRRLVHLYPLLGLMLAAHLNEQGSDADFVADLTAWLTQTIPGHPDAEALAGADHTTFPPTIASVQESALREVATGTAHIQGGSVAEKAMEGRVRFGGWTTWVGSWLPESIPAAGTRRQSRLRVAALGAGRLSGPLLRAALRTIGLPSAVQLGRRVSRLGVGRVHASLAEVSAGKDLPTVLVLDHIRFLLEAGDIDTARRTLQGRRAEETAAAVLLSVASVRKALDRVNPELRQTLAGGNGRRRSSTGNKPPGGKSGIGRRSAIVALGVIAVAGFAAWVTVGHHSGAIWVHVILIVVVAAAVFALLMRL